MKSLTSVVSFALGGFLVCAISAAPAHAQATRTWVSGVGDDVNPCSRTAPCKTFAGAISKTAAGGEINCLDPGGYGTLTITKSISIDCAGTLGSTLNSGGINGFVINNAVNTTVVNVVLRNLSIDGAGTTPGARGIHALLPGTLLIENVSIFNQSIAGINLAPATGDLKVMIKDTTVHPSINNSGGILVKPGAGNVSASLTRVNMFNGLYGLRVEDRGKVTVYNSVASDNTNNGFLAVSAAAPAQISLINSVASNNGTNGASTVGASATIRLLNSSLVNNVTGINTSGGGVVSGTTPDTNLSAGNSTDGTANSNAVLQ